MIGRIILFGFGVFSLLLVTLLYAIVSGQYEAEQPAPEPTPSIVEPSPGSAEPSASATEAEPSALASGAEPSASVGAEPSPTASQAEPSASASGTAAAYLRNEPTASRIETIASVMSPAGPP